MAEHLVDVRSKNAWQQPVEDKDLSSAPGSPSKGDRYILGEDWGSWNKLDEDCSGIGDWIDLDGINGESTQATFDSKSCFKFDTNIASSGNLSKRQRTIVVGLSGNFIIELNLYLDAVSASSNNAFNLNVYNSVMGLVVKFQEDGLFIFNGTSAVEVGTDLVQQDVWQKWRFDVKGEVGSTATVDVYIDDVLIAHNIDCSYEITTEDGKVELALFGYNDNNRIAYADYVKISSNYGYENQIGQYNGTNWNFYTPLEGWKSWVKDEDTMYKFNGTDWLPAQTLQIDNDYNCFIVS